MSLITRVHAFSAPHPRFGAANADSEPRVSRDTGTDFFSSCGGPEGAKAASQTASDEYPPSMERNAIHPRTQRTLQLQQWGRRGENIAEYPRKAPVVLIVHGLAGRPEWQAPLIEKILDAQNQDSSPVLVYTIHMPEVALNDYGEGHIEDINDLVAQVREAIEYLGEHHEAPVYAIGKSLGGLLLTDVAANPPDALKGVTLVSPAYRPLSTNLDKAKVVAARGLNKLGLLAKIEDKIKRKPTKEQQHSRAHYPEGLTPLQKRILRDQNAGKGRYDLTAHSYLQILNLMKDVREHKLRQITLPTQIFYSESDTEVDPKAIEEAVHDLPNMPYKDARPYENSNHDLVVDPKLDDMAGRINERIATLFDQA